LEVLVLKGCIVTIDAMGCQKEIARQIIAQDADYILALKGNQSCLLAQVQQSFALEKPQETSLEIDLGHGRIEKRNCSIVTQLQWVEQAADWPKLTTLIRIQSHTQEKASGKISTDCRFFISSLQAEAEKINQAIRAHWAIENTLHWCLDVAFQEDKNRTRSKNADQNLAVLRRIALNALKKDSSSKLGLKNKRLAAGWDNNLLAQILNLKV
jgi:predicted transposase YbfD/YdcC